MSSAGQSYIDIVWSQFRKNRAARWSLWLLGLMFLLAIFAPLLASNVPFVFDDGNENSYPWFRAIFNPGTAADFAFNMAMIGFFPWVAMAWLWSAVMKRNGDSGKKRLGMAIVLYAAIILGLCQVFGLTRLRPANSYADRTFPEEAFQAKGAKRGWYPPIPFGPTEQDLSIPYKPPLYFKPLPWTKSNDYFPHLLGTDDTGSDVLVRLLYGSRISLTVGFVAVSIYMVIGVVVGAIAGYFGGRIDMLISRVIEIMMLFPAFFLILILVAFFGRSIYIIMLVIGITSWPGIARLIRGEVLKQRSLDYTAAARALGSSNLRIIFRHILPNALSPALVAAPFGIASAIVLEAGLSLLGFGVEPPAPTWGALLQLANNNYSYWWLIVVPSIAIFVTVTIFNLVGSGLRDAMDPRLRI